jgi:hypothetical protein
LLPKDRYHRFGDVIDAPEVGLELGAEVLVVGGLDRRDVGVADLINDDVQAAEVATGVRDAAPAVCAPVTSRPIV